MDFNKLKGLLKGGKKEASDDEIFGDEAAPATSAADTKAKAAKRDPRKAEKFFEHAHTVADTRNYDYAIEMYISGLRHDPDNIREHDALREVAVRRKVARGKAASMKEQLKPGGSTHVEKMLQAEKVWAMSPLEPKFMVKVMKYAVAGHNDPDEPANLGEVAFWIGELALEFNNSQKRSKSIYKAIVDYFGQIGRWDKAKEAMLQLMSVDPDNPDNAGMMKTIEAEKTIQEGQYADSAESFRDNVKDMDKQEALQADDTASREEKVVLGQIERRRAEWEEDTSDTDKMMVLVETMLKLPKNSIENEAIQLLKDAYEETEQYRFKMRVGDIKIRQYQRYLDQLQEQIDAGAENADELRAKLASGAKKKLAYELQEYADRVQNYPTDAGMKYELGRRMLDSEQVDEAIGMFQQCKNDPKLRSLTAILLGQCYIQKDWMDEAVSTLKDALKQHKNQEDKVFLELNYELMEAMEALARKDESLDHAKAAQQLASVILQKNIQYRNITGRMDKIKELVNDLKM